MFRGSMTSSRPWPTSLLLNVYLYIVFSLSVRGFPVYLHICISKLQYINCLEVMDAWRYVVPPLPRYLKKTSATLPENCEKKNHSPRTTSHVPRNSPPLLQASIARRRKKRHRLIPQSSHPVTQCAGGTSEQPEETILIGSRGILI
jgi:hypothetical protein